MIIDTYQFIQKLTGPLSLPSHPSPLILPQVVVEDLKGLKEEDGQASSLLSFMTSGRQHKSKVKDAIRELDTSNNLFIFQTEALDR